MYFMFLNPLNSGQDQDRELWTWQNMFNDFKIKEVEIRSLLWYNIPTVLLIYFILSWNFKGGDKWSGNYCLPQIWCILKLGFKLNSVEIKVLRETNLIYVHIDKITTTKHTHKHTYVCLYNYPFRSVSREGMTRSLVNS